MKTGDNKILQIITALYGAAYFTVFIIPFFTGEMSFSILQDLSVLLAFLFFLCGFIVSWFNEKIGGSLLQAWVVLVWALGLFYWPDGDMAMVLAVPVLSIGVFMNRKAYLRSTDPGPNRQMVWKYTLQLLLHNYVYLYLIIVIAGLTSDKSYDFLSMPFIFFPFLFILFLAGVALSYRKEFAAGIIFIIWYIIIIFGTLLYFDFYNSGPWFAFGITLLLQGILYLAYHSKFKTKPVN